MKFLSTRSGEKVSAPEAIVFGLAQGGGLYVPESFPAVTEEEMNAMCSMDYPERTAFILKKYLEEYDEKELLAALKEA